MRSFEKKEEKKRKSKDIQYIQYQNFNGKVYMISTIKDRECQSHFHLYKLYGSHKCVCAYKWCTQLAFPLIFFSSFRCMCICVDFIDEAHSV